MPLGMTSAATPTPGSSRRTHRSMKRISGGWDEKSLGSILHSASSSDHDQVCPRSKDSRIAGSSMGILEPKGGLVIIAVTPCPGCSALFAATSAASRRSAFCSLGSKPENGSSEFAWNSCPVPSLFMTMFILGSAHQDGVKIDAHDVLGQELAFARDQRSCLAVLLRPLASTESPIFSST